MDWFSLDWSGESWMRVGLVLIAVGCYGALVIGIGRFSSSNTSRKDW